MNVGVETVLMIFYEVNLRFIEHNILIQMF